MKLPRFNLLAIIMIIFQLGTLRAQTDSSSQLYTLPVDTGLSATGQIDGISNQPVSMQDSTVLTSSAAGAIDGVNSEDKTDNSVLVLPDLIVYTNKMGLHSHKEVSKRTLYRKDFKNISSSIGDPVRAATALPGIGLQNDININPLVRGGKAEETRVFLNNIPLIQPYHMSGVFSVFNMDATEQMSFYSGGFPVEGTNSLSGALHLKTRRPDMKKLRLHGDLSVLRGTGYLSAPLIKDRLSVYSSYQVFLFNDAVNGLLEGLKLINSSQSYQDKIVSYQNHINMPRYQDFQTGFEYRITPHLSLAYHGIFSGDSYDVIVPRKIKIYRSSTNDVTKFSFNPNKEVDRAQKLDVDSISFVRLYNHIHAADLTFDMTDNMYLRQSFSYQYHDWNVDFKVPKSIKGSEIKIGLIDIASHELDITDKVIHTQSELNYAGRKHTLIAGADYELREQKYHTNLSYPLYDLIANSNFDLLKGLGYYNPDGFEINRDSYSRNTMDYLGEYALRIDFEHRGEHLIHHGGMFASHSWEISPKSRIFYGIRGEAETSSNELFFSPRASFFRKINDKHELTLSAGLYSQNTLPFYQRNANPLLISEKSLHTNLEWSWFITKHYRIELQNYYKHYFDLVTEKLGPTGRIDIGGLLLPNPQSNATAGEIDTLKYIVANLDSLEMLPDSIYERLVDVYGEQKFSYSNSGTGFSYGSELSLFYDPAKHWRGWLSLDLSISRRQDHPGERFYDQTHHSPWIINWVNFFDMPSKYELALKYRYAAGHAYTNYSGTLNDMEENDQSPIVVEPRNSSRYKPYSRFDIRLTKNAAVFGNPFKMYLEIWNMFNKPNYFARDNETGELKSAILNWPFPVVFFGINYKI